MSRAEPIGKTRSPTVPWYSLVAYLVFLLVLFPYVTPFDTPFDTQPYAVCLAGVVALAYLTNRENRNLPLPWWILLGVALYACGVYLIKSNLFAGGRSLVGYFSLPIFSLVGYAIYDRISEKAYILVTCVYFVAGLLQLIVGAEVVDPFVARVSTGRIRGITSLTPEPSSYAFLCLTLLLFNELLYAEGRLSRKTYALLMLLLVFQILAAASAAGLLYLLIFILTRGIAYVVVHRRSIGRKLAGALLVGTLLLSAVWFVPPLRDSRAGQFATSAVKAPVKVLQQDGSVRSRTAHMVVPFLTVPEGNLLGLGLGTFKEHGAELASSLPPAMAMVMKEEVGAHRIMSGWGTAAYELGLVGVLLIATAGRVLFSNRSASARKREALFVSGIMVFGMFFMSVPLAFPPFGFLLGVHLHYRNPYA